MVIPYPRISPVIVQLGPIALRWYGLMYLVGYFVGFQLAVKRIERGATRLTRRQLDTLVGYLFIGMLVGARLVYVIVYDSAEYRAHPLEIFAIWRGGLSFHGAILGMTTACAIAARRFHLSILEITDTVALCGTPGLFFGRLGNFINAELYGRPSTVPWAMVFPSDPLQVSRHPSQLYEALTEGVVLFMLLCALDRRASAGKGTPPGLLTGSFLVGYSVLRFLLEFTRQPDAQLGLVLGPFSMGQLLSTMMLIAGLVMLVIWRRRSDEGRDFARP